VSKVSGGSQKLQHFILTRTESIIMQLSFLSALAFAVASAGATALPAQDVADAKANQYKFSIFQQANCAGGLPFNVSGTRKDSEKCSPQPEFFFASVLVQSNAGDHCNITFYESAGEHCSGKVAEDPGKIQTGKCFTFSKAPETYGVVCN
jgi:hypothetical protein